VSCSRMLLETLSGKISLPHHTVLWNTGPSNLQPDCAKKWLSFRDRVYFPTLINNHYREKNTHVRTMEWRTDRLLNQTKVRWITAPPSDRSITNAIHYQVQTPGHVSYNGSHGSSTALLVSRGVFGFRICQKMPKTHY
jgi:hypothetical protein